MNIVQAETREPNKGSVFEANVSSQLQESREQRAGTGVTLKAFGLKAKGLVVSSVRPPGTTRVRADAIRGRLHQSEKWRMQAKDRRLFLKEVSSCDQPGRIGSERES